MTFEPSSVSKHIATRLLYLEDQYMLESSAIILDCYMQEDQCVIVVDCTPMYVKRGGQPSDSGTIAGSGFQLSVTTVALDASGRVQHIGSLSGSMPKKQDEISIQVDAVQRHQHSLWHSAGEAVIVAAKMASFDEPVCGAIHYGPNQNRIEYRARISKEDAEELHRQIQAKLIQLISDDTPIRSYDLTDKQEVIDKCGFWPDNVPEGDTVRVIQVRPDYTGRPCTGTHLATTGALETVKVDRVKPKGDKIVISYSCDEA